MLIRERVPDEVWEGMPPRRLPRWRVLGLLVLASVLAFGAYALSEAGVLAPNVTADGYGGSWTEGSDTFTAVTTLTNRGSAPVTIESIAVPAGSWLRPDRVTNADIRQGDETDASLPSVLPLALGPHEGMSIELWFTVVDCSAIDRAGLALTARATSPLGTRDIDITPAGQTDPAAPSSYSWSGTDPWLVPWPATYASSACGTPLPLRS